MKEKLKWVAEGLGITFIMLVVLIPTYAGLFGRTLFTLLLSLFTIIVVYILVYIYARRRKVTFFIKKHSNNLNTHSRVENTTKTDKSLIQELVDGLNRSVMEKQRIRKREEENTPSRVKEAS